MPPTWRASTPRPCRRGSGSRWSSGASSRGSSCSRWRPISPAELPRRGLRAPAVRPATQRRLLAAQAHEQPDPRERDERDHDRGRGARSDGDEAEVDVDAEDDSPDQGDHALVDARRAGRARRKRHRGDRSRGEIGAASQGWADQKNSPSRSRFRPQLRLTFRLGSCEPLRTTSRCCFVLLPRRARRMRESMASPDTPQGVCERKKPQFAIVE